MMQDVQMSRLERRFRDFHRNNPAIYELFDRFTRQAIRSGHRRYSADAILHRVRWHTAVETRGDAYKINNDYAAFYARLWMDQNPRHRGFFATRVQKHYQREAA